MAKETSGIIYDIGGGKYGLALNRDQRQEFYKYKMVFMRQYLDINCQIPYRDSVTGKQYVALKHIDQISRVGFQD